MIYTLIVAATGMLIAASVSSQPAEEGSGSAAPAQSGEVLTVGDGGAQSQAGGTPARAVGPLTVESHGQVDQNEVPVVAEPNPAEPVGQLTGGAGIDPDRLWEHHLPDPTTERAHDEKEWAEATAKADQEYYRGLLERLSSIDRPRKLSLSLEDALRRALIHNFALRVASYNPAVETAKIVEAEAAFDAAFFANLTKNKQNQPTASVLVGSNVDTLNMQSGIAKLLPTGMQATTSLNLARQSNDFQFQTLNPQWDSSFAVELRQPWLRGFGIDFNRSAIVLANLDHSISEQAFRREVIRTLVNVEQAYWNLVRARREVVISGQLLSSFQQIYDYLWQRRDFDAYKIQIADTEARLERSKAQFIQVLANVRNAEDQLINLMNDPQIDLADEVEILPLDFPGLSPVVLDCLSEVQVALDHRPELAEAKLQVKRATVAVGQAKNQVLPKLDTTFRYTVDGMGPSAHDAFSEVSKNDFHEYFISVEFEIPFGNRAARARERQARLRHAQAIANLEGTFEGVILDVNLAVRNVQVSFDQILPNFESVEASEDQVEAIKARAESRNFVQLNQELNALQALAAARRELMVALVDYTMAIIKLEQVKGTLPEYNNVILATETE